MRSALAGLEVASHHVRSKIAQEVHSDGRWLFKLIVHPGYKPAINELPPLIKFAPGANTTCGRWRVFFAGYNYAPARRRACIAHVRHTLEVSERRVCAALGQHRSTQRKRPLGREDDERMTADIIELARCYGRYGYRKIAALLSAAGWAVNDKRVGRIWRREGPKVPSRQPKRGRLWLSDGSCIRLRAAHRNHVWAHDFVEDCTHAWRKCRIRSPSQRRRHDFGNSANIQPRLTCMS